MASGTCTASGANVAAGFLNVWFTAAAMSPSFPTNWYIALDCGTPTTAGLQYEVSSGNSYARLSETRNSTQFSTVTGTNNTMNNALTFSFAQSSGVWTGNSGANTTIIGAVIMDAASSGNPWWYGTLTTAQTVVNNNILQFLANNFQIQLG